MLVEKRLSRQYDCLLSAMEVQRTVVLKHLSSNRNEEISFGRFLRNPRVEMSSILSEITRPVTQSVSGKSIFRLCWCSSQSPLFEFSQTTLAEAR